VQSRASAGFFSAVSPPLFSSTAGPEEGRRCSARRRSHPWPERAWWCFTRCRRRRSRTGKLTEVCPRWLTARF